MRLLFSLFLLLFSSAAISADYYWTAFNSTPRDSAVSACDQAGILWSSQSGYTFISSSIEWIQPIQAKCLITYNYKGGAPVLNSTIVANRFGDSCPPDTQYNGETGGCDEPTPNTCADTAGSIQYHLSPTGKTRPTSTDPWPAGSVTGSPTMCSGSCQYSLAQSTSVQCGSLKYGDPLIQYCLFKYSGTGQSCQSGDPAQNNGSTAPVPPTDPNDPTDPANNCGPTHVWSGTTCVPKLDPDPADPTDPGTGGTDPGTGGGGPGTGGGDPGTGGGDPGTGGGDPGTGGGDPGDDGPDEEGDPVKGETCDLDLTCEGDAIQCAMLREQKTDRCNWELNQKNMKQIVDSFTGDKYELGESTTDIGLSFNSALSSPRFLPSGCPAPQRITIQGRSYSLTWAYVCDFASGLSYVIVALAGLFFVVYVGRGFGGD